MATAATFPIEPRPAGTEQRVLVAGVPWATYVVLRDSIESAAVRMTYLEGLLEIMSPSREHEVQKKRIARLLELFCLERDIPLFGYGSTTFRKEEEERGLEPDECYARGEAKQVPDIAIEVVVSRGSIDKLDVYRGLGVREVWVFEGAAFQIFALRGEMYLAIENSEIVPEIDLARLAILALWEDQHAALRAYRDEVHRLDPR